MQRRARDLEDADCRTIMQTAQTNHASAFTGIAGNGSLTDLIQMECSIRATRAVRIEGPEKCGRIYFSHGEVVHAEVGELSGESALFEILAWPGGKVVVAEGVQPASETIDRHWERLLEIAKGAARPAIAIRPRTFAGRRRR